MATRTCARCHREKSIRGVWYLTPLAHGAQEFVCESCFASAALTLPAVS